MIQDAEIRRRARAASVEPRIVELDYALDEYGRESLKFTLYWRGPHASGGSPPGLRLDITRNEILTFSPVSRPLFHPFSDADDLGQIRLTCYALEEVMTEKVRAVLGQRLHTVSRDVYDIFSLLKHVDEGKVRANLSRKLEARETAREAIDPGRLPERRDEFLADWERNLAHLLPPGAEEEFEEVWDPVVEYVGRMATGLGDMPPENPALA